MEHVYKNNYMYMEHKYCSKNYIKIIFFFPVSFVKLDHTKLHCNIFCFRDYCSIHYYSNSKFDDTIEYTNKHSN